MATVRVSGKSVKAPARKKCSKEFFGCSDWPLVFLIAMKQILKKV
jgi:hypothetical protein